MSENKSRLVIKRGSFYRVKSSLTVPEVFRGKIVRCIDLPTPPDYRGRFNLKIPNLSFTEKLHESHLEAEVYVDLERDNDNLNLAPAPINPSTTSSSPLPKHSISESGWLDGVHPGSNETPKAHTMYSSQYGSSNYYPARQPKDPRYDFPWVKNQAETQHSNETASYIPRDALVWVKPTSSYRVLWDTNIPEIKFTHWKSKGVTFVRRYPIKDGRASETNWLDGFSLTGDWSVPDIQKYIAENIVPISKLKDLEIKSPYRVMLKRVILSKKEWQDKYKPNSGTSKSYTTSTYCHQSSSWVTNKVDTALESLQTIVDSSLDITEYNGGSFAKAMAKMEASLRKARYQFAGEFPIVEVIGVWFNFNPDSQTFFMKNYDCHAPFYIMHNHFKSAEQMKEHPL